MTFRAPGQSALAHCALSAEMEWYLVEVQEVVGQLV